MNVVFCNVDTQYDFMRSDGKLYVQGAETIEGNLERLTKVARMNGLRILSTADWHTPDSKEISEDPDFVETFPEHCMAGTRGAEFISATKPKNQHVIDWRKGILDRGDRQGIISLRELVLHKDKFDVFEGNPHTEEVLDIIKPEVVIVYGVATNVCVDYAVRGLLNRGVETLVVKDAIKELPGLPVEEVFDRWNSAGTQLVDTDYVARLYNDGRTGNKI